MRPRLLRLPSGLFGKTQVLTYTLDLFEREGRLYRRSTEYHRERAYEAQTLTDMLLEAGFRPWSSSETAARRRPNRRKAAFSFLAKA